jgi:aminoglycoside phosphotransferase (APT) family kinase protein
VADAEPPFGYELIAGGRSNLTYQVTDSAGHRYALRRPPLSHVLPTAHDMGREYRVISALVPTAVPVPRTYGLCEDEAVNGRPFYVMEFVDGLIVRDAQTAERTLDPQARRRAGESLTDTLAALHAVDVDAVGLGDFAKRQGYITRQLRRWDEQFRNSPVDGIDTASVIGAVHDRLAADIPPQVGTAIVHGDYRLDNTVLAPDGTVRAVLDWEICTLGDPLADVGLLMVYWTEAGDEAALLGVTPTTVPGFSSRAEIRARYEAASGRDLGRLDFYVAFGYWKLACILQGVYARYVGGATAGDRSSVEGYASSVVRLGEMALHTLESA